ATGRLTLRPYSVVHSITYDRRRARATGVRVIDGQTKHALEFKARIVFLCASTIESARILLLSGIANSSGQVGKNLMDHIMGRGVEQAGFGAEYKKALRKPGPWGFSFYGFGEMLPKEENLVEIDKNKVDAWGIPVARITCAYGENEKALVHDMSITAAEMLAE